MIFIKKTIISVLLCCVLLSGCAADGNVQIDLTTMSAQTISPAMAYSMAVNIVNDPGSYAGQTICVEGIAVATDSSGDGKCYVTVVDETGCCQQNLEFVLSKDADYPADGETVQVVGTLQSYTEDGQSLIRVEANDFKSLEYLFEK